MTSLRSLAAYALLFAFPQLAAAQAASETSQAPDKSAAMLGYTPQTSAAERDWEKKFQDGIVATNIRENMRRLSARPHHVGSPYDKDNAEWMLARFKEWGFDAHIETLRRSLSHAERALARTDRAQAIQGQDAGAGARRRSHIEPDCGTASDLQRLFRRWRRHRARWST